MAREPSLCRMRMVRLKKLTRFPRDWIIRESVPQHAFLHTKGRVEYLNVTDEEAMKAGLELSRMDGIIPAIETAHAIAATGSTSHSA